MKSLLTIVALVLWSGMVAAQHNHGAVKGPNGGPMQDIAGVHAELVVSGTVVTINLLDESNKPAPAKGFTGQVLIVSGGNREMVPLAVVGDSALRGEAKAALAPGASITLVLRSGDGKSGQVKF